MARRPTSDHQPAQFTRAKIERGIKRLEQRRKEVEQFDPTAVDPRDPSATTRPLRTAIEATMVEVFGAGTIEHNRYYTAAFFSYPISMAGPVSSHEVIAALTRERVKSIQLIESAIAFLKERLEDFPEEETQAAPVAATPAHTLDITSRKVFIVHGHDDGMKEGVARFLGSIGFAPIILHEQPNRGLTIIQKFREEAKDVGFAVVLLSPDDEITGGQHRARQNVILELGFFLGALGPERVAALKKGDVETPSDFDGVIYTAFDGGGGWKVALSKELQAAGYSIDWNAVMA